MTKIHPRCKFTPRVFICTGVYIVHMNEAKDPVTLSRFKPRFTTTHPDLRQMVKSVCIGMRRDGKKRNSSINTMSHDAPTVSARFIYGSTTTYDGSATIHHGGATNANDAATIRYGASTIQAGGATVSSQ